jgi:hypothetical protein
VDGVYCADCAARLTSDGIKYVPSESRPQSDAQPMVKLTAAVNAYKLAYEYLQDRMRSIGREGWSADCDGEIEDRINSATESRPQGDATIADYEEVLRDKRRLTKELDRLIDSTASAENPSLCDVVGFVAGKVRDAGGVSLIQQIETATTAAPQGDAQPVLTVEEAIAEIESREDWQYADRQALWKLMYEFGAQAATTAPQGDAKLSDQEIREVLMLHGYQIKPGLYDLKPYVYEAARAIALHAQRKISATTAAHGVPDGYKLVPIKPTPKMVDATWEHEIDKNGGVESQGNRNRRIYKAMLNAAPSARQEGE